ncbi:AAWKG family protein [Streptomyces sp. NPDC094448]|uniref:AAWKG family protein n=1 Tax=Streptomyces sp. NPDC094448 TaxID=3366063 RepID=UPI00382874DF
MAENVVYPADSVDDYWHTAVQVLTGYVMPKRELLFGSLVGNDSIPLMRVEFSDHDGEPSNAVVDAVNDMNWRTENSGWRVENTDFVVPFYSGKDGPVAEAPVNTRVKMKKARITLLGTSGTADPPAGGVVLGGEFKSGLGKDFQGQAKDTVWSNKALAQYSYGGGKALEQLLYNGSTLHFTWNDLPVHDADAVDLGSFDHNAQAFDRVAQFFAARTRELKDWEFDLGKQEASWKGQAAGVFKDLVHGLVRTYESYSEQFPVSGTVHSTYGNDLRGYRTDVTNAARKLHGAWDTWQLLTGNPLRWLHDVLLDVTDHVWRNNITKVRYQHTYSPRGYASGGYHYVKYENFSGAVSPYGMLEQKDTWKRIGEEAIRRWQKSVQDVLSAAGKQALIDVENAFNDQKFPEKVTTVSVNLGNLLAKDQAFRDRAEAARAKAEAEEKLRLAKEEAERKALEAEEKARLLKEEAERKQAEAEARAEQRQREAEERAARAQAEAEARAAKVRADAEAKQEAKEREAEQKQAEAERRQAEKEAEQEARQERLQAEQEQKQAEQEAKQEQKEREAEQKQAEAEQRAEQKQAEQEAKQEQKEREAQERQTLLMNQARFDREQQRKEQERKQAEAEAKQEEKEAEQEARQERLQAEQEQKQAEQEAKQEQKEREAEQKQGEAERKQAEKEAEQEAKQAEQEQKRIQTESEYRARQEEKEQEAEQKQAEAEAKQERKEAEQEARQERLRAEQEQKQAEAEAGQEQKQAEAEARREEMERRAEQRQGEAEQRAERQLRDLGPGAGSSWPGRPDAAVPDGLRLPEGSGPGSSTGTGSGSTALLPGGSAAGGYPAYSGAGGEEELYDRVLDSPGGADYGMGAGSGAGMGMPMLPMGTRLNGTSTGGAEGERVRGTVDDGRPVTTRRAGTGQGREEFSAAGRGSLATASGGMPYMPPMGGADRQTESGDRERMSWVEEEEDVWGTDEGGAPAVIGR